MAEACLFDNRIRKNSIIIPEQFFTEQELVVEPILIKGERSTRKTLKKKVTNIPSHGWEIEMVKQVDNEIVSPYLTWATTPAGDPVEVKVPLPTVAISQRIWRFYAFRITLNDILSQKILSIMKSNKVFDISLLKTKITEAIGLSNKDNQHFNHYKIEIAESHDRIWISISVEINAFFRRLDNKTTKTTDDFLLAKADEIKSYIANL